MTVPIDIETNVDKWAVLNRKGTVHEQTTHLFWLPLRTTPWYLKSRSLRSHYCRGWHRTDRTRWQDCWERRPGNPGPPLYRDYTQCTRTSRRKPFRCNSYTHIAHSH